MVRVEDRVVAESMVGGDEGCRGGGGELYPLGHFFRGA